MPDARKLPASGSTGRKPARRSGKDKIKLFISYSHDSEPHKEWVKRLARRLERDEIDVVFDQQDLRIAMSASYFMESSLRECDRVLLVITEPYVIRSNNLIGGVAYERMIISAEIAKNMHTSRFIPLLRAGTEIPTFLGDRIFVDARDESAWERNYRDLLTELRRPIAVDGGRQGARESVKTGARGLQPSPGRRKSQTGENYHWSHAVHSHVGNKLYLLFVKFVSTGVKFKESVVENIVGAGVSDYSTFELYASHDLLIRAWADQKAFYDLRKNILENPEVDAHHTEIMEANGVHHFPDGGPRASERDVQSIADTLTVAKIDKIQNETTDDDDTRLLIQNGLRIPDSVRFNRERTQFYIIVRALRHDARLIERFETRINEHRNIYNKTIYYTTGNASEAVIKGQVRQNHYYEINDFVNAVATALENGDIRTETALVAHEGPRGDGRIDTHAAERYLIEKDFRKLIGHGRDLSPIDDLKLLARFAEATPAMVADRKGVLREMVRLRARGESENFDHIRTFFAELENRLQSRLSAVIHSIFGSKFEEAKRELLVRAKIADTGKRHLVLGDLTKVYRVIIEEHGIIELDPLKEEELKGLMVDAVEIRNKLAHGVPELTFWENTFQFFQSFVRIDSRLHKYLESIP